MGTVKFSRIPDEFHAVVEHLSPRDNIAWYDPNMDQLMYMKEDVQYRAERVDEYLTLFWHGQEEEKLVGMKFKGFRAVFDLLVKRYGLNEGDFIRLVRFIEYGMTALINKPMLEAMARDHLEQKYSRAEKEFKEDRVPLGVLSSQVA